MISMALLFPDMLKGADKSTTSTMRVAVFMIVSVFVVLCVKVYWSCDAIEKFRLDRTWAYVLGVALGSKAVQSFGENNALGNIGNKISPPSSKKNPLFNSNGQTADPLHHSNTITAPPNQPPASIVAATPQ
jgi:hypothetical protein